LRQGTASQPPAVQFVHNPLIMSKPTMKIPASTIKWLKHGPAIDPLRLYNHAQKTPPTATHKEKNAVGSSDHSK